MRIVGNEGSDRKKKISRLIPSKSVKHHFKEYCKGTTIHGIKYFVEENRPLNEKISWILMFLLCVGFNGYLIQQVWKKWNNSPVIVSFAETATSVWNTPFPAVTICSEVISRATQFDFASHARKNVTDPLIAKQRGDVSLLCDDGIQLPGADYVENDTMEFLSEVAPPINHTILICRWKKDLNNTCTTFFKKLITDEGICYSFNILDRNDLFREDVNINYESDGKMANGWTLDEGYSAGSVKNEYYPDRTRTSGTKGGLFVVLAADKRDADYYCRSSTQGFKVLLHNPAEFPRVGERYLRVPLNQEVMAVIQPNIMTTSKGLKSYTPHQRHCYFQTERDLAYFKIYTQTNCEIECLANYTMNMCGCSGLHMPRKMETKICGPGKKKCMVEADQKLRKNKVTAYNGGKLENCDCLPACTSISYNVETSQADYNFLSVIDVYGDNVTEFENFEASRLTIFFKDSQFTTSRRNELYGIPDFLASCGGLLGLFCGISVLSFVELVYYITLRIWGNITTSKKAKKKNLQESKLN